MTFSSVVVEQMNSGYRLTGVYQLSETVLECQRVRVGGMDVTGGTFTLAVDDGWVFVVTDEDTSTVDIRKMQKEQ
jgi:hypothetical protein